MWNFKITKKAGFLSILNFCFHLCEGSYSRISVLNLKIQVSPSIWINAPHRLIFIDCARHSVFDTSIVLQQQTYPKAMLFLYVETGMPGWTKYVPIFTLIDSCKSINPIFLSTSTSKYRRKLIDQSILIMYFKRHIRKRVLKGFLEFLPIVIPNGKGTLLKRFGNAVVIIVQRWLKRYRGNLSVKPGHSPR